MTSTEADNERDAGKMMTNAITEVNAYRVASYVAAVLQPAGSDYVSHQGYQIWNRSWSAAEMDKKRDAGIKGVLEASNGPYQFKFTPKSANDTIDTKSSWSGATNKTLLRPD
jgi:hypothetical protein